MSVYSNRAAGATDGAAAYIAAVLELVGDRDPLTILGSTVSWCRDTTEPLTAAQLGAPEAEGKWSVAAVLQHLADSELVWGFRLRLVLSEDRPVLTGFDQDLWGARLGYGDADRAEALSMFSALRSANLRLLSRASSSDLDRVGVHNERGEESIRYMMRLYGGHDLVHRRQLERLVDRLTPEPPVTVEVILEATRTVKVRPDFTAHVAQHGFCLDKTVEEATHTYSTHYLCGKNAIGDTGLQVNFAVSNDGALNSSLTTRNELYVAHFREELKSFGFKETHKDPDRSGAVWLASKENSQVSVMWEELKRDDGKLLWHIGFVWRLSDLPARPQTPTSPG